MRVRNHFVKLLACTVMGLCLIGNHAAYADLPSTVAAAYLEDENVTVIHTVEKQIDAHTGLVATFNFEGHKMQEAPEQVSFGLFGYHDQPQWQSVKTLTLTYGGKQFTGTVLKTLHGPDRDTSQDLVPSAVYSEAVVLQMPLATAQAIFRSASVTVDSSPSDLIHLTLTADQMDPCRDLLGTIPGLLTKISDESLKTSANGLPIIRKVDPEHGDVSLETTMVRVQNRIIFQAILSPNDNGKPARHPFCVLILVESGADPAVQRQSGLTLVYGTTRLPLSSMQSDRVVDADGQKDWIRVYHLTDVQLRQLSKAHGFHAQVGKTQYSITRAQMAGIIALAQRIK